ncbi:GRP family sugar transporter [Listeria costaricensis]|uniref:GRP family sugar transporter n=1 Tax=Listeria costaricensis TaxID=2026604 RepID=UPI000C077F6A|nr:GRP family sugar transporter [Listeria costaricensis]
MNITIALIPALLWGFMPLIITKVGGTTRQQTMGVTLGALLFACIVFLFSPPTYTLYTFVISFMTGCLWAIGQMFQLQSFKLIGVSKAMPISTGMQLVGTTLCGVLLFHEWDTMTRMILGFTALALIVIGIFMTSYAEKQEDGTAQLNKGLIILTISSLGYISYVVVIQGFHINGFEAILPQALGMVVGALLMTHKGTEKRFTSRTWLIMIPGMIWAAGNLAMLYANGLVGVATGFSLSQLGVVISTLGGIILLGEKKTKKEMVFVLIGVVLVVAGGILIGVTKGL